MPPVKGLLSRWLDEHHLPQDAALLLDELNRRIADSGAAIGPSYLTDERIYRREDGLDRVWQAAAVMIGHSTNGPDYWTAPDGRSYNMVFPAS